MSLEKAGMGERVRKKTWFQWGVVGGDAFIREERGG